MKGNGGLKRLYDRFKPEERFRLALEALARNDEEELDRLARTCPRKTYSQTDAEYMDLLEASWRIADQFVILWLSTVLDYHLSIAAEFGYIGRIQNFVKGYALGANATAKRERPSDSVPFNVEGREPTGEELDAIGFTAAVDGFPKRLEKRHRDLGARVKAIYEGLRRFCKEVGVEPEKLLAWFPPILEDVESLRGLLENKDLPADEERAEMSRRVFLRCWPDAMRPGNEGRVLP